MEENEKGDLEPNEVEEGDNPVNPEEKTSDEQIKTLAEQKKHWREKAEKLEAELKAKGEAPKEETPKEEPQEPGRIDPYEFAKEMSALQGYSRDELDIIQKHAQRNNLKPAEAVSDKELQEFIGWKRDKVAKENKIPDSSSPRASDSLPSDKEIQTMSDEDFQKLEQEFVQKKRQDSGV